MNLERMENDLKKRILASPPQAGKPLGGWLKVTANPATAGGPSASGGFEIAYDIRR